MLTPHPNTSDSGTILYFQLFLICSERYIDECLESIVCQTLRPWEVIVVDNCSTDGSWSIIQEVSSKIPGFFRLFKTQSTLKQHELAIFALSKIEGDYISWIDNDDRWTPDKLASEWKALTLYPQATDTGHRTGMPGFYGQVRLYLIFRKNLKPALDKGIHQICVSAYPSTTYLITA